MLAGGATSVNTPRLRYSGIIRDLQKYWLLRGVNPGPATYSLRPHARALCERLHATLFSELVVSEAEAAFKLLRENIGEGDESFLVWAGQLLPQLSLNVEQQLVALDNAIETAVARLRQQTSHDHDEAAFVVTLEEVDATLADLLQKATELGRAFGHTVELQAQLTHLWASNDQEQTAVNQAARQALRFIDRARQRLDELSQRLSWVHPRVQALFGNLGKLRFDRKTEQFLLALLRAEPGSEPDPLAGVPLARLAYQPLRFDRVPTAGQVLPAEPVQAPKRVANDPAQQAFQARTEEQLRRRRQGRYWLGELRRLLAPAGASVRFVEFGQRLAAAEGAAAYDILARLLATVRREDEPRRGWQLAVDSETEETIENDFTRLTLWKLTITNP